jgi:hypothetical protein
MAMSSIDGRLQNLYEGNEMASIKAKQLKIGMRIKRYDHWPIVVSVKPTLHPIAGDSIAVVHASGNARATIHLTPETNIEVLNN